MRFLVSIALAALLLPAAAVAAPELEIPRVARPPVLEDFLDMQAPPELKATMAHVDGGFIQQRPVEGDPASNHTDVYIGYDDTNLYAVFVAFDDDPSGIRANLAPREQVFGDDIVEIKIDTFFDRRNAYAFVANPRGVQWDAIWTEGRRFDMSFDTVWSSRGELTDRGYVVWMAIPFKSLRFPAGAKQRWGFLLVRDSPGRNEETFYPQVSTRIEGRLQQAGTMTGMADVQPGRNAQVIPYVFGRSFRTLDRGAAAFVEDDADLDAGLDAKLVFRDKLVLDMTVNPDFSQIESDQPQITVNERFEVFFPERRPFFLENAGFLGSGGRRLLVFTRRIVEPRVGARLTGKLGKFNLGVLAIDDEAPGKAADPGDPLEGEVAKVGIFRLTRDVGEQSQIGVLYTGRELGEGYNRVGGFDARIKLNDNWVGRGLAVIAATRDPDGSNSKDDPHVELQFDRSGRHLSAHIHAVSIGEDYESQLGFVPRNDVRDLHARGEYTFRPEGERLLAWGPSFLIQRIDGQDGIRRDAEVRVGFEAELRRQTEIDLSYENVDLRFTLGDILDLFGDTGSLTGPRELRRRSLGVRIESRPINAVGFSLNLRQGRDIDLTNGADGLVDAKARIVRATLDLRPLSQLAIDNAYLYFDLDTGVTTRTIRSRWNWQFTRRASLRTILQYRSSTASDVKSFNSDVLFTYLINPFTAIYAGYNGNRSNLEIVDVGNGPEVLPVGDEPDGTDGRQLFVKVSYLHRF